MYHPSQYDFPTTHIQVGFWFRLESMKLNVYRLSDEPHSITGWYGSSDVVPGALTVDGDSFAAGSMAPADRSATVTLHNLNIMADFSSMDRKALIRTYGERLWNAIRDRSVLEDPSLLVQAVLLTYADLKAHKFWYSVAYPCVELDATAEAQPPISVEAAYSHDQLDIIYQQYKTVRQHSRHGYYSLRLEPSPQILPLASYLPGDTLVVVDPSNSLEAAGWFVRNAITALRVMHRITTLTVFSLRESKSLNNLLKSMQFQLRFSGCPNPLPESPPRVYGWGDGAVRTVDLSAMMDPNKLAESSANLNLSLMKWRTAPDLRLDDIAQQKCLLIGAGTLGCNVARHLLMWGVRHITFIDRGTVSYSNPVRQSLFLHSDAVEGKDKATAAADGLKRVHPTVVTRGESMTIPMPGHPYDAAQRDSVNGAVDRLDELIREHDVTFLLTDSRESRWLPTLIAAVHRKFVINAALGFDTWVVMRHGMRPADDNASMDANVPTDMHRQRLGCYFCSDVIAPRDSLTDRTLDQQCTVTRPAVSALASAYAVELLAGIVNHPLGPYAPAALSRNDEGGVSLLGLLPQQLRGNVFYLEQTPMLCGYFTKCLACSDHVVTRYQSEGFDFVGRCLNEPTYLEHVTGTHQVMAAAEFGGWEEDDIDDV